MPEIPVFRTVRGEKGARRRWRRVRSVYSLVVLKVVVVPLTSSEPPLVAVKNGFGRLMVCCEIVSSLTIHASS